MSPRAACRLTQLGFTDVYDYVEGKAAWMASGLPVVGTVRDDERVASLARPAGTCTIGATVGELDGEPPGNVWVVVDDAGVVHGEVRSAVARLAPTTAIADVVQPGVVTARPSMRVSELAEKFDEGFMSHVVVTRLDGTLIGIIEREDVQRRW
ncbi:MAG: CBS domain-containing protein [Actinobacteria bacterium]|nr:CBS domain-containing protein [Actinomycetota bacterium]